MSAREARREANRLEHRIQQAEKHERLSIERRAKREANEEAHRLEQAERDQIAKAESHKRAGEKLAELTDERLRVKAENDEKKRQAKIAEEQAFMARFFPKIRRGSDDDE